MCDEGEPPTAWRETWRTARKPHQCIACGETIEPRHRYHFISGIWDGEPGSYKHCARCWAIYCAVYARSGGGWESPALDLACGELWSDNFEPESEPIDLAFMTPAEAQELAK